MLTNQARIGEIRTAPFKVGGSGGGVGQEKGATLMVNPNDMAEAKQAWDCLAPLVLRDINATVAMKALLEHRPRAVIAIALDAESCRNLALNAYIIADAMEWARQVSAADRRAVEEGR